MSYQNNDFSCCGIAELATIYEDESAEHSLLSLEYPDSQAVVIFSDIHTNKERGEKVGYTRGRELAALIKERKLGVLVELPPARNPNTNNNVKVWAWKIAQTALKKEQARIREKLGIRPRVHWEDRW